LPGISLRKIKQALKIVVSKRKREENCPNHKIQKAQIMQHQHGFKSRIRKFRLIRALTRKVNPLDYFK
jgi:type IV secretory pathway ATPase VirB11/archaellum biosynthesis ATPase